jgi:hypothetical protein
MSQFEDELFTKKRINLKHRFPSGLWFSWICLIIASLLPQLLLIWKYASYLIPIMQIMPKWPDFDDFVSVARAVGLPYVFVSDIKSAFLGMLTFLALTGKRKIFFHFASKAYIWFGQDKRLSVLSIFIIFCFVSKMFLGFWFPGISGWTYESYKAPLSGSLKDAQIKRTLQATVTTNPKESRRVALESSIFMDRAKLVPAGCWKGTSMLLGFKEKKFNQTKRYPAKGILTNSTSISIPKGDYLFFPVSLSTTGLVFPPYDIVEASHSPIKTPNFTLNTIIWHSWNSLTRLFIDFLGLHKWKYPPHTPSNGGDLIVTPKSPPNILEGYELELCKDEQGPFIASMTQVNREIVTPEK